MSWQRRLAPLALVVAVSSACSGGGEQPDVAQTASTTTTVEITTTTTTITQNAPATVPESVAGDTDAPQSLAFSSTADLGRLFEIDGSAAPAASAGSDDRGETLTDGTVVQATNLRSYDGTVWVRINTTDLAGDALGWVEADSLRPTTQSVERYDANKATEFRQVSQAVVGDILDVYASPSRDGSKIGSLIETEVAMHGGNNVLSASGDQWVDVIDSTTQERIGWVLGESFTTLTTIEAKGADAVDVDRRADPSTSYGGSISAGEVTAVGCNAQQITFEAQSSTLGSAIVFGNAVPTGEPLRGSAGEFSWSATGGSTVFVDPGETVTFTFPSQGSRTWYFTTLGVDGQATHDTSGGTATLNASGEAVATDVQEFPVSAGSCAAPEVTEPTLNPYIDDLPEDEQAEALAAFEEELADFRGDGDVSDEDDGGSIDESDADADLDQPASSEQPSDEVEDGDELDTNT